MILWISSETSQGLGRGLNKLYMGIEKQINSYLKDINYSNDKLKSWDIIITIRDDDVFNEIVKYRKAKKDTDFHLKIDYDSYESANDAERKNLIYKLLLRSLDILKEKGLSSFEPVEEFIKQQII